MRMVGESSSLQPARNTQYIYGENSWEPLARADSIGQQSDIFWYHTELNGLPERMTDEHGEVVWRGRFSTWGETSYPGVSRGRHFQEANESLLKAMESDKEFAQNMKELGINLERTPTELAPRQPPTGWTWHHELEDGLMRLVPRSQHTPGSEFWKILHPDGYGGYAVWGK